MRDSGLPMSALDDLLSAQRAAATEEVNAELDRQLSESNAQLAGARKDFQSFSVLALGLFAVIGGYMMLKQK